MFKKKKQLKSEQRAHKSTYRNPVLVRGRVLNRMFELKGKLPEYIQGATRPDFLECSGAQVWL